MMYCIYVFSLIFGVYFAPGLALMPRAAFDSRLAYAIPIVSVLIVTTLARALKPLGFFSEFWVFSTTLAFAATAAYRLYRYWPRAVMHWPTAHRLIYLFCVCAALPIAVRLGLSSFDHDDEIYSWNMWGVQHARGEPHDLYYTVAPYPQTFPYLIAWSYQLLGSIDLQLPVKCSFAVLSVSLMSAVGIASSWQDSKALLGAIGLVIFALYVVDIDESLSQGLAETLMVPAMAVSVALYLQHARTPQSPSYLWLASCTAVVAGLAKQPALVWLMLVLPALILDDVVRRRSGISNLVPVSIGWCLGVAWLATEGNGFWDNEGVVIHSQANRSWFTQLMYASNKYLVGMPALTTMLVLSAYAVLRGRRGQGIFFGLLLPALFLWFLFGAYEIRLGAHVLVVAALLIGANELLHRDHGTLAQNRTNVSSSARNIVYLLMTVAVLHAGISTLNRLKDKGPEFSFYDGGKNTIYRYFGEGADFIYHDVYRSDKKLWIPSNYIYGIFYGHNSIVRPDHRTGNLDAARIKAEIARDRPDYLFESGDLVAYGPATALLRDLVLECRDWFERVVDPTNKYGYTVYRLNNDAVDLDKGCTQ